MITIIGSGSDIDTIHGFLAGVYAKELSLLGYQVQIQERDNPRKIQKSDLVIVQDIDPTKASFLDWLVMNRTKDKVVLCTQDNFWGGWNPEPDIPYVDFVVEAYHSGAVDHIVASTLEGYEAYKRAKCETSFMCPVGAPSWWIDKIENIEIEKAEYDIICIGNKYNRRHEFQEQFLEPLRAAGFSVLCTGEGYEYGITKFSNLKDLIRKGKLVLAVTTPITRNFTNFCTGRVFTGPAAGRVTIATYFRHTPGFLDVSYHLATPDNVVDIARYYLHNYTDILIDQIRCVEERHLYKHRVEELLRLA